MKALIGENDDRILGFTMIGANAGEVMAVVQTADAFKAFHIRGLLMRLSRIRRWPKD